MFQQGATISFEKVGRIYIEHTFGRLALGVCDHSLAKNGV